MTRRNEELATTCLYCSTDNLFSADTTELQARAQTAIRTLAEAVQSVRTRLKLIFVFLLLTSLGVAAVGAGVAWVASLEF